MLLENKWLFLIGAEVSFWVLTGAFLVLRYWFGSDRGSLVLLALIVWAAPLGAAAAAGLPRSR